MKVLLVKPFSTGDHIQPALGLGYLASYLRDRHSVAILDCIKEKIAPHSFGRFIEDRNYDVIGIQCYTFDLANVRKMLFAAKRAKATTVIGGPHPSTDPINTMGYFGDTLDYAFCGEAESGFKTLLEFLSGASTVKEAEIPGLIWKEKRNVTLNDRVLVDDLDSLGMPAWDIIKPQEYPPAQHGAFFKNFPIAPIILTRGCPYPCTFCAASLISGKTVRKRSIDAVIKELRLLRDKFGIKEFQIIDDNFVYDKKYATNLLKRIKEENLGMSWSVPNGVRMESLDEELLTLMRETGLYLISLGIESGSDRILQSIRKGTSTGFIRDKIRLIRKVGIDIAGFFVLGFPGETREEINQTISFSLELDLVRVNYFTYSPLPGTDSYRQLEKDGNLERVNWNKYFFNMVSYSPQGIDRSTLERIRKKAFLKFYLRPRVFMKNISQIKSFSHLKYLFKRFYHWIIK